MRACQANGTWMAPDPACAAPGLDYNPCVSFPCDINSVSCTIVSTATNSSLDRSCGQCRYGFANVSNACIDIILHDVAKENIASSNVASFVAMVFDAVLLREQSVNGVMDIFNFTSNLAQIDSLFPVAPSVVTQVVTIVSDVLSTSDDVLPLALNLSNGNFAEDFASFLSIASMQLAMNSNYSYSTPAVSVLNARMSNYSGYSTAIAGDGIAIPSGLSLTSGTSLSLVRYASSSSFDDILGRSIASGVVGLTLSSVGDGVPLSAPITFSFAVNSSNVIARRQPTCAYFDFNQDKWDNVGCTLDKAASTPTNLVCKCSHLTHFAILLDTQDKSQSLGPIESLSLHVITYVGCSLSILLMLAMIVIYLLYPDLRTVNKVMTMHLCFALIAAQLIFLIGIDRTSNRFGCQFIAALLQYFLLVAFAWMIREALALYQSFVIVFGVKHRWILTYACCYGIPAIIVLISGLIRWDDYGANDNCWLSTAHGTRWAFIAPVLVAIVINIGMFVRVLMGLSRLRERMAKRMSSIREVDRYKTLLAGIKVSVSFASLLGITWVFGALAVDQATTAMFFLFAIFNTLQGVFIFIFHCFWDDEVRSRLRSAFSRDRSTDYYLSPGARLMRFKVHSSTNIIHPGKSQPTQDTTEFDSVAAAVLSAARASTLPNIDEPPVMETRKAPSKPIYII